MSVVLVLDSDKESLHMCRFILITHFTYFEANTETEFYDLLKVITPNIFIIDIANPESNGIDVVRELRKDSRYMETPIIFLVNESDTEIDNGLDWYARGASDYVYKPLDPIELYNRVDTQLRLHSLVNESSEHESILNELASIVKKQGVLLV